MILKCWIDFSRFFCELTLSILKCISYSSKKYWLKMPIMHSYKKEIRWMTKWFCNALFRGNSTYQERKNHDVKPVIHCILWVHNQVKQYRIVHQRKYIFLCQKKSYSSDMENYFIRQNFTLIVLCKLNDWSNLFLSINYN